MSLQEFSTLQLRRYNYDKNEMETIGQAELYDISKSAEEGHVAYILEGFLNRSSKHSIRSGEEIGRILKIAHRTLQRKIVGFCLGVLHGIADQEYTDPRNADAINTAKKISKMMDNGDLPIGPYI